MGQNIRFHGNDYEKLGFMRSEDEREILWQCPQSLGRGGVHAIRLRSGFQLLVRDFTPRETVSVTYEENSLPLIFSFLLSGGIQNDLQQGRWKRKFLFAAGQTSLTSFPAVCGRCVHPAGEHMRMINIWISETMLSSLLGGVGDDEKDIKALLAKGTGHPLHFGTVTPASQTALFDIANCPYHGAIRRLFLESKCMELICHQLEQIAHGRLHPKPFGLLSACEVERIHHARELLVADLKHPPSVARLSKMVGINDYKLRQGFRKVFGTTIFEQLRRQRLARARVLLERGDRNVAEAAFEVGYSDLKHFYQAFKKQFHTTPGACRM